MQITNDRRASGKVKLRIPELIVAAPGLPASIPAPHFLIPSTSYLISLLPSSLLHSFTRLALKLLSRPYSLPLFLFLIFFTGAYFCISCCLSSSFSSILLFSFLFPLLFPLLSIAFPSFLPSSYTPFSSIVLSSSFSHLFPPLSISFLSFLPSFLLHPLYSVAS